MPDDYAASTSTTGTVTVGGSATGTIETSRDVDWFAVELLAGRTYVIDHEGAGAGGGTLGDTMLLGVFDDAGGRASRKSRDGGEGGDARLVFTATETGTHYIAVRGGGRDDTGTYTVRVRDQNPPPPPPENAPEPEPEPAPPPPENAPAVQSDPAAQPPPAAQQRSVDADATRVGAIDLGALAGRRLSREDSVDGGGDAADYWRFTLDETQAVTLSLRRQDANADLYLEDADGNVLESSTRGGTRREEIETALEAGTYYVRVAAREAGNNEYLLRARADDPAPAQLAAQQRAVPANVSEAYLEDFPADSSTSGQILIGGSARGYIDRAGDRDWFAVTLEAGTTYSINLKGQPTGDGSLSDPYLYGVFDSGGTLVANTSDDDGGDGRNSRTTFTAEASGTYYVAAGGYGPNRGTYAVKVDEVAVEDPDRAADTSTTGTVAVGGAVKGVLHEEGDRDWFKVELKAGTTYLVDLKGSSTDSGTLDFPELTGVYDADGKEVQGGSYHGGHRYDARLYFTPEEDGTYFIGATSKQVKWWLPAGRFDGDYTLAVADAGIEDDFAADASTTGTLPVGGTATGTIEQPHDVDWFSIDVEAGKAYRVSMTGPQGNPYLHGIYDADGNQVHEGSGRIGLSTEARVFIIEPTEDTTYYVAAGPGPNDRDWERLGGYSLSAAEIDDDFAADASTTATVAVGGSKWGEVQWWGDRDWFAVTLEKGETYEIELHGGMKLNGSEGSPAAGLWDWYLRGAIYDADGNRIDDARLGSGGLDGVAHWPPGCAAAWVNKVGFTPTESGTYYVEVDTGNHRYNSERSLDDPALADGPPPDEAVGTYMVTVVESEDPAMAQGGTVAPPPAVEQEGIVESFSESTEYANRWIWAGTILPINHDFAADTSTLGRVAVGDSATGWFRRDGDVDWFAVTLEADKSYRFDLKGRDSTADMRIRGIHDAEGDLIDGTAADDGSPGGGVNSRVEFEVAGDGTYYVSVGDGESGAHYSLSVLEADAM